MLWRAGPFLPKATQPSRPPELPMCAAPLLVRAHSHVTSPCSGVKDVNKMDALAVNAYLCSSRITMNKIELENLFDHFGASESTCAKIRPLFPPARLRRCWSKRVLMLVRSCDMAGFLSAVLTDGTGVDPVMWIVEPPPNPNAVHLALSGVSHTEFAVQDKAFPKHWGQPPNATLKGHMGVVRPLAGGYGKVGNRAQSC